MDSYYNSDNIRLQIADNVKERLDERRICLDEIKRVIVYAENTGIKILNKKCGSITSHLVIGSTTYWVEYSIHGGEFILRNAYTHRIQIMEERLNDT